MDIVNADLATTDGLVAAVAHRPWLAERVSPADLAPLRLVQRELAGPVDNPGGR